MVRVLKLRVLGWNDVSSCFSISTLRTPKRASSSAAPRPMGPAPKTRTRSLIHAGSLTGLGLTGRMLNTGFVAPPPEAQERTCRMSRHFGVIRQNGYVVRDLRAAMDHWIN